MSTAIIGWDIGGVNTKVARVANGIVLDVRSKPFEIQRAPNELVNILQQLAVDIGASPDDAHAITMTAELSQHFRTKGEGVNYVVDAVERAFPHAPLYFYTTGGEFLDPPAARARTLQVAAANWSATAHVVGQRWPTSILIDIGTTTTDIIPIVNGRVVAKGRTDPERLESGELVYLGAVRTPVEAIVHEVPLAGGMAGVSAEGFALAGDVHLWRGDLAPADYSAPTPDTRPVTREFTRERLARVVCADREMLDDTAIDVIAEYIAEAQVARIARMISQVHDRHPEISLTVAAGLGAFLAVRAAGRIGLDAVPLSEEWGDPSASRSAPAAAVALLLDHELSA